ncbi:MAG: hypothetical protein Q4C85_07560 [Actinomyces sp.]|uniref:hypothetical protein n=1 Tax=Actinomyces sp. TaxID=29317 RepID=UPI0026DC43CF|nr:hypothetical protein [Actinomyces sp.]MDO4243599.1 hypothetical protein [Actinomyces sp.]
MPDGWLDGVVAPEAEEVAVAETLAVRAFVVAAADPPPSSAQPVTPAVVTSSAHASAPAHRRGLALHVMDQDIGPPPSEIRAKQGRA